MLKTDEDIKAIEDAFYKTTSNFKADMVNINLSGKDEKFLKAKISRRTQKRAIFAN